MSNDFDVEELVREINYAQKKLEWEEEVRTNTRAEAAKGLARQYRYLAKIEPFERLIAADRVSTTAEAARRLELGEMLMRLFNEQKALQKKNDIYERVFDLLERIGKWILYILCAGLSLVLSALIDSRLGTTVTILIIGIILIRLFGEKLLSKLLSKLFHADSRTLKIAKIEMEMQSLMSELFRLLRQPEFKDYNADDAFIYALYTEKN